VAGSQSFDLYGLAYPGTPLLLASETSSTRHENAEHRDSLIFRYTALIDENRRLARRYWHGCERTDYKNLAGLYSSRRSPGATCAAPLRQPHPGTGTGGPGHHTLLAIDHRRRRRPHMTGPSCLRLGEHYYFTGGPRSRKIP